MHIISLDERTIAAGRSAMRSYLKAQVCGQDAATYDSGMARDTGVGVVAGAILECLEAGITDRDGILHAVARASRCRRHTVERVLEALIGQDRRRHLWAFKGEQLHTIQRFDDIDDDWEGALIAA